MTLRPGQRIAGRYRVLELAGRGGMGAVFQVEDERLRLRRALKELRASGDGQLAAFRTEFTLLAGVTHPHVTRVLDFGSALVEGAIVHYYVAEWVEGETLGTLSARGTPSAFLPALVDALDGLSALHELGIRHGDFTPENVLVDADGRGVLIDLGCARAFAETATTLSGTPGFIAPELLASGAGDARSDLYAVGETLRALHERAGVQPEAGILRLTRTLLSPRPSERPEHVDDVIEALDGRRSRAPRVPAVSRQLVGRDGELEQFQAWIAALIAGKSSSPALALTGPPGVGKSRLLREMVLRAELSVEVVRAAAGEPRPVAWLLAAASGAEEDFCSAQAALSAARRAVARRAPLLVVLEDADRLEPSERDTLWAFVRSLDAGARVAVLFSTRETPRELAVTAISVLPLDRAALAAWTRHSLSHGALDALLAATGGVPAAIEAELLLRDALGPRKERAPNVSSDSVLEQQLSELDGESVRGLALLVALGGEIETSTWPDWDDAASVALTPLFVQRDGTRCRLRDVRKLPALLRWLGSARIAEAHRSIVEALQKQEPDARSSAEIIRHAALGNSIGHAERRLAAAEPLWRAAPRSFVGRVQELARATRDAATLRAIAELALLANDPELALASATRCLAQRPERELAGQARLLAADALIRLGRGARAERLVQPLTTGRCSVALRALGYERLARARLQLGNAAGAERAARHGLLLEPEAAVASSLDEALGLASSYLGHAAEAESCFARVLARLDDGTRPRERCRVLGQRAILAFRAGRSADAAADHAQALAIADRHAEDDLVAACCLNLGTAEQQLGELGSALAHYERGLAVARAVGRRSTELTLRYNLANLRAELGDFAGAARDLAQLEEHGAALGLVQFAPAIALVRAEIALANRELDTAARELDTAERLYAERGLERELVEVAIRSAELDLARGAHASAESRAESAEQRALALDARDLAVRAGLVRGSALLARGDREAVARLESALAAATESGARWAEAEISTELLRAAEVFSPADRAARAHRAERAWGRLAASLPEELRGVFWRHPRRSLLSRFTRTQTLALPLSYDAHALGRLLSLGRRINSSLSLDRVLDYAVDAAVELSGAERGFLLLDGASSETQVVATRTPSDSADPPSRSIVEQVLTTEEPVLTTDAENDERFRGLGSVHALRLKSVLCVPVTTPAAVIGALYVDTRVQRTRFTEADLRLLLALADQVAVAVANARLYAELERRARELEEQKQTVERLSRRKDRELERLRQRVESHQRALSLRYDYSRIVGRGPKMRAMLEKLDRIIDSEASVLIQGESGTGKELVARALHVNGARKDGPFVGVNCAALPEALLESELFGYVRGAFTGADRDKRGLLLAADGGTLFLDEIGDLPAPIQVKLLRVLQEREVQPLGATRANALDVRLVCATHSDLSRDVREGRFREDLFYRIAVVGLELPPLRERVEDIPELARATLARLAKAASRPTPELSREALRALALHPFPGNVRELENVLTRAFVLCSGPRIGVLDLELAAPRAPRHSTSRREFESEERERILDALRASRWNVSTVARVLGVPRNTLYRKLARYGLERPKGAALSDEVAR